MYSQPATLLPRTASHATLRIVQVSRCFLTNLQPPEFGIVAVMCYKLLVGTVLDNLAAFPKDQNAIQVLDR